MSEQVTLGSLPPGARARIVSIDNASGDDATGGRDVHLRLYEMGFDEGVEVEVLHKGPIGGDPIAVQVGGMTVAMRRSEAGLVKVLPGVAVLREAAE